MIKHLFAAVVCVLMVAAPAPSWAQKQDGDQVWQYADDDAAMNGARAEAQRTYPQFLAALRADTPANQEYYMVKVGLQTGGDNPPIQLEHIWVDHLRFEGDVLVGALANAPDYLPGMQLGSRVEIETTRVSDWSITRREGMFGNFTTRVMLDDIPPEQAAELREVLTRDPLPSDWRS